MVVDIGGGTSEVAASPGGVAILLVKSAGDRFDEAIMEYGVLHTISHWRDNRRKNGKRNRFSMPLMMVMADQ